MEQILYHLISHIKENMPSLSMVDEDYGQLEAIDNNNVDMYPITFPAVLVDAPTTEWGNIAGKSQLGKTQVTVRLIIDCYDDHHYGSETMEKILQRTEMVAELHRILQCHRPTGGGELIRERSKFYTWNHGIKVYESTYTIAVEEIIQETETVPAPRKVSLSVGFLKQP